MKAGFGLVSVLIVVALIMWMQAKNATTVLDKSKNARKDAAQFAGQDMDGVKAKDSIKMEPVLLSSGKLKSIKVTWLMPLGPMESYYGLMVGDEVVQANQLDVKDSDTEMAPLMVLESYSRKLPLIVMRGTQKLRLPPEDGVPAQPQAPSGQPSTGAPASDPNRSTIQGQLDKIPGIKR
jgi:hypothetical protein